MSKSKKVAHRKVTHAKAVHHTSSTSSNSLFKSTILGHKLTPPFLIIIGIGLVILQGIIALVGFAVIVFGIISLVTNLFKSTSRSR